jgi:hypothetical protein
VTLTWLQIGWLHEISQSALAAAVAILGAVILLELQSIKSLRRSLDAQLNRVFEQLDLLRFENQQPPQPADSHAPVLSARAEPPSTVTAAAALAGGNAYAAAAALASTGMRAEELAQRCGLAAGEARLLVSLAAAKSRRET